MKLLMVGDGQLWGPQKRRIVRHTREIVNGQLSQ